MTRKTPRLATWLFKCLAGGTDNNALLGDLEERYRRQQRASLEAVPNSWCRRPTDLPRRRLAMSPRSGLGQTRPGAEARCFPG